jgi:hypothetical protein
LTEHHRTIDGGLSVTCDSPRALAGALISLAVSMFSWARVDAQSNQLQATYQFLVSDQKLRHGALYQATAGELHGAALPLSFFDTTRYWGVYVCQQESAGCAVTDEYNATTFALSPGRGIPGDLQIERVNVHNGTNIYDAATWQIAVVLGAVINKFGNPQNLSAYELAANQNRLLSAGYSGNATKVIPDANRAITKADTFRYNGQTVSRGSQAYTFRMLPRDWLSTDPLIDSPYDIWIKAKGLPAGNSNYRRGQITWSDWKPITGENAWAFLLGPLHAAYIHYVLEQHGNFVPFQELAVQNALAVLPTFAAMQSQIGAVYYAASGTSGTQGEAHVSSYEVSVENNFSLYAGLRVLESTLRAELKGDGQLGAKQRAVIRQALETIAIMIHGGKVGLNQTTEGLLAFFRTKAWQGNEFVQGGLANDPKERSTWIPTLDPKAIDANTWGLAALGAKQLDEWFGFGTAYQTWQQAKSWGAYGVDKKLLGVGYSNHDGNGLNADRTYRQGILSAEWTAGAINMIRSLNRFYARNPGSPDQSVTAAAYVVNLRADELAMLEGVQTLRFTNYVRTAFPGKPDNYVSLITQMSEPYVYASRRYRIPFGWYANPIPSTCSTAWIIMIADGYDPFGYAGVAN